MNIPFNGPQFLLQCHTHAGGRCAVCGALLPAARPNLEVFYPQGSTKVCSLSCAAKFEAGLQECNRMVWNHAHDSRSV